MTDVTDIREANLDDLETLLAFEQGVIETERPLDPFLKKGAFCYYNIPAIITSDATHFVVAIYKNELVGCGYVRIEKSKQYQKNPLHGYIGFIYVKPNFRGKRISSLVLESLKKWALSKELKELRLDVYSNNPSAIKSYARFGFVKSLVNMRIDI
ncbi:GNAT family N-acetyltransferase [Polaribacter sp.]|nr:GNAT family N-acetyltransferase [Polaribacter sp.]MDB4242238.1 GNAT family N-acetyltransferase [Polaribacter sp.]